MNTVSNLKGKIFGNMQALKYRERIGSHPAKWLCICTQCHRFKSMRPGTLLENERKGIKGCEHCTLRKINMAESRDIYHRLMSNKGNVSKTSREMNITPCKIRSYVKEYKETKAREKTNPSLAIQYLSDRDPEQVRFKVTPVQSGETVGDMVVINKGVKTYKCMCLRCLKVKYVGIRHLNRSKKATCVSCLKRKFTIADCDYINSLYNAGNLIPDIAREYNVQYSTIQQAIREANAYDKRLLDIEQ